MAGMLHAGEVQGKGSKTLKNIAFRISHSHEHIASECVCDTDSWFLTTSGGEILGLQWPVLSFTTASYGHIK